ncbi:MAG TPA: hypothetical protein VI385_16025 [Flavisolibacter sp.]
MSVIRVLINSTITGKTGMLNRRGASECLSGGGVRRQNIVGSQVA